MATMEIQRPEGVTLDMYRAVQDKVGIEADPPDGLILHTAGLVNDQLQIVNVWESSEAAERFVNERLMPAIRAVAGDQAPTGPPSDQTTYELLNMVRP
ncbi:MAG: hypothetical protein M3016_08245 [Actinomycetota bacterium]|nr:hypothetical protein [Actinomycetota bacterium]